MSRLMNTWWTRSLLVIVTLVALLGGAAWAQETGHYPLGAEGLKAASIPGPGQYLKWYNFYYESDRLKDNVGNDVPGVVDIDAFATAPRLIWLTNHKFLGADYGWDILVPLIHTDLELGALGVDAHDGGLGDIYVEPLLLGWHTDRYDLVAAAGVWTPNGDTDGPAAAGKGFWTGMFTLGGTTWLDEEKRLSVSALSRYETHSRKRQAAVQPGDNLLVEWGVARNYDGALEMGVAGYCQWQLTADRGAAAVNPAQKDQVFAAGPEVNYLHQPSGLYLQLRYQFEFEARNRSQGRNLVFSVVKGLGR